jgi:hypothetical protein
MGDALGVAESLVGLAEAVAEVEPAEAARLLGAASARWAAACGVPTPRHQADVAAVRRGLDDAVDADRLAAAQEEGTAMDPDAAVARALDVSERVAALDAEVGSQGGS